MGSVVEGALSAELSSIAPPQTVSLSWTCPLRFPLQCGCRPAKVYQSMPTIMICDDDQGHGTTRHTSITAALLQQVRVAVCSYVQIKM
jgi:hypothetical protein